MKDSEVSASIVNLLLVLDKIIEVMFKLVVSHGAGSIGNGTRKRGKNGCCIDVGGIGRGQHYRTWEFFWTKGACE